MKSKFKLLLVSLLMSTSGWAQSYLQLEGSGNDIILTQTDDFEYSIVTTGGDPFCKLSALEADMTEDENAVIFEYQCSAGINGAEFFFSQDKAGFVGGREMTFDIAPSAEWTSMSVNISKQCKNFGWGTAGDFLRFDFGGASGVSIKVRNIHIGTYQAPDIELEGLVLKDGVAQISTADELEKFAEYSKLGKTIDAVLLNDIDYSGHTTTIGSSTYNYDCVFDGTQHSITVDFNRSNDNAALFECLNGTVKNLVVKGDITTSAKYAAAIAAHTYSGAEVSNCVSLINVISTIAGDGTHGGFVAVNEGGLTIDNCIFLGSMTGSSTNNCGGIVGWSTGTTIMNNCVVIADMTGLDTNDAWTFSRNPGNVTCTNCYYAQSYGSVNAGCTQISGDTDWLTSGEACFKINGDQQEIHFYQNLTENADSYPVPWNDRAQVYANGELRCDGTPLGSVTYSNDKSASTVPDHQFEEGICTVCGKQQGDFIEVVDGYYQIGDAQQLVWFANYVNSGNTKVNARLTADIDLTGREFTPIGTGANYYSGTFDGQMHRISNLNVNMPETQGVGFIGIVTGNATIKNLILDETCNIEGGSYGGLIGCSKGSGTITMTNLGNEGNVTVSAQNAGGIIGCCDGSAATFVMNKCYSTGTISGARESSALSGWFGSAGTATNCWTTATVTGIDGASTYLGRGTVTLTNCYATAGSQGTVLGEGAGASGELCYKLNGSSLQDPTWYQTIGEDSHPVFDSTHGIVYDAGDGNYGDIHDDESFVAFRNQIIDSYKAYADDVVAQKILVDEFNDLISIIAEMTDLQEYIDNAGEISNLKKDVEKSAAAYKAYMDQIDYIKNYLEENHDFSGEDRDFLQDYLEAYTEPNDELINGSYEYIIDNRELDIDQINEETSYAKMLLERAIANGYEAGTDITNLLVNADLSDGFNGWEGTHATGTKVSPTTGIYGGECWNTTFDQYQTLTDLKNGVYVLKMTSGFRPNNTVTSTNYAASIYAGENMVYMPSVYETYISVEDAVDGVNCNLTAGTNDLEVTDEEGNLLGYAMHGQVSVANAAAAGRAITTILTNVTDGNLTVGIKSPGTGCGSDWTGFANIHLIYMGTLDEAMKALDETLASQVARATTLVNAAFSDGEDFAKYPNFQQTIKDGLTEAIAAVQTASTPADKYALIQQFSQLFEQVYASKQAYIAYLQQAEDLFGIASELAPDYLSADESAVVSAANETIWAGYLAGSITLDEAQNQTLLKSLSIYPVEEDGVMQINNNAHYLMFVRRVNNGETGLDAKINADVDYCRADQMITTNYSGTLDGDYHTITVNIDREANDAALFQSLYGTAKNLIVRGTITTSAKYAAAIAAHTYNNAQIQNISSYVDIVSSIDGDGTHAGIVAVNESGCTISSCLYAGTMTGEITNSCGGIVGWSSGATTIKNCLQIADIQVSTSGSNTFSRNSGNATIINSYYLNAFGAVEGSAIQTTVEDMKSGALCYQLNGNSNVFPTWRQNLGVDEYPVPNANRQIVSQLEDGTYSNEGGSELANHAGTAEDPYPLSSLSDLKHIRECMHPGEITYFTLEEDIDMSSVSEWKIVNCDADYADGKPWAHWIDFNGKGHVIKNFSCTSGDYASFFGVLCGNVRNVGFENVNVVSSSTGSGVLGGYIGHSNFVDANGQKQHNTLENVWVTGNLTVTTSYCGGLVGNVGGPTTIKNCYANLTITSKATYTGGLIGRVRDALTVENVYAAGTQNLGCGIVGGGQNDATPASTYTNCVVWNNTDQNFGVLAEGDTTTGISYYDGSNFAQLQQTVVSWGAPWSCDMQEGSYPVLDLTTAIQQIAEQGTQQSQSGIYTLSGVRVQKITKPGLYIQNGKTVLVK